MSDSSGNSHPPQRPEPAGTPPADEDPAKWGTHIMGQPAAPNTHPDNQKAASWRAEDQQQRFNQQHPYVVFSPVERSRESPLESVVHMFNDWSHRAETVARNIWHNLNTGPSVSGAAWGKLNLTAKALTEGGFESLYRQTFATDPNERLKRTFACYLSTSTGYDSFGKHCRCEPWFMGFVNFDKASHHLLDGVSDFRAYGNASRPPVASS